MPGLEQALVAVVVEPVQLGFETIQEFVAEQFVVVLGVVVLELQGSVLGSWTIQVPVRWAKFVVALQVEVELVVQGLLGLLVVIPRSPIGVLLVVLVEQELGLLVLQFFVLHMGFLLLSGCPFREPELANQLVESLLLSKFLLVVEPVLAILVHLVLLLEQQTDFVALVLVQSSFLKTAV